MNRTKRISTKSSFASSLHQYPNAGPNANLTGMRNRYWGKGAFVIRCGQYIYCVPQQVFENAK